MTRDLTPYDTGSRLEPLPHVRYGAAARDEDVGRVDFDNEESSTVLAAYVEREEGGYVLHLDQFQESISIVADSGLVFALDSDGVIGLGELVRLAQRGREADVAAGGEVDPDEVWPLADRVATDLRRSLDAHYL
jgi:hypothetical protein